MIRTPYHELTGVGDRPDARREGDFFEATALVLPPINDHSAGALCAMQNTFACAIQKECEGVASDKCTKLRAAVQALPTCPCPPRHDARLGEQLWREGVDRAAPQGACACAQSWSTQRD